MCFSLISAMDLPDFQAIASFFPFPFPGPAIAHSAMIDSGIELGIVIAVPDRIITERR
jgi:hypothetical protein